MFASPCVTAEISPTEATDDDSNTKIVHCIHLGQELGSPTVVFVGQTMVLDMPYLLVTCMSTGSTWSEMVEDFLFPGYGRVRLVKSLAQPIVWLTLVKMS